MGEMRTISIKSADFRTKRASFETKRSKTIGNVRKRLKIFENFRKMVWNVRKVVWNVWKYSTILDADYVEIKILATDWHKFFWTQINADFGGF